MVRQTLTVRLHALTEAQGYKCAYCNEPFLRAWQVTFDHVVPRSRGGSNTVSNGLATCQPCNLRKGNRPPTEDEMAILARIAPVAMDLIAEWSVGRQPPAYRFDFDAFAEPPPPRPKKPAPPPRPKSANAQAKLDADRQTHIANVKAKRSKMAIHAERRARNMQRAQESKAWPYNSLPGRI